MPISRRSFLNLTLVTAGGAFVAACSDDESPTTDAGLDTDATADGGDTGLDADAGADIAVDADVDAAIVPQPGERFFPQSVASGDPGPGSIVLWTRVIDDTRDWPLGLRLELATDEAFTQLVTLDGGASANVLALPEYDRCARVRVEGLEPDTVYWYRFVYTDDAGAWLSRTGRTRTAPLPDADRAVRFAFVSCQDITGTYYNTYKLLLDEELDFVVHLGDYVYETTGDPSFQASGSDRAVYFGDEGGAISIGEGDEQFFAARSLDNYRDLYRTYRGDRVLQAVHERYPMIVIADDHEFSDDCWGANGTYFDGRADEADVARRKAANQAWFEYMPVDYLDRPDFAYDAAAAFPGDLQIWRDVRYGRHVHLVLTDLRTWRPDHVIGEDEYPGNIAVTEAALTERHGGVPDFAQAYVDLDAEGLRALADQWAAANAYPAASIGPLVAVAWVNRMITDLGLERPDVSPDGKPRGIAIADAGKGSLHTSLGSRYLAVVRGHDLVSAERYLDSLGASEDLMGSVQRTWFTDTVRGSDASWKIWGNEFCLSPKIVDVSTYDRLPDSLRQKFYLSVEDWGGAMNGRDDLIAELADVDDVVSIVGDIHAFFAGTPFDRRDPTKRIPEFVTAAISSGTYERLLVNTANSDPGLRDAGAAALALLVPDLLVDPTTRPNPDLVHAVINEHGFAVVEADAAELRVTFHGLGQNVALTDLPVDQLRTHPTRSRADHKVVRGARDVWSLREGTWQRWDMVAGEWRDA